MSAKRLLIAMFLFALSGLAAAQDTPPYIYYPFREGYIIERADATDSHFVGSDLGTFPQRADAGWSPSGKWIAWRGIDTGGCGERAEPSENLVIAGADGGFALEYEWVRFAWSLTEDRLFVLSGDGDAQHWQILDPSAPDLRLASGEVSADSADFAALLEGFFHDGDPAFTRNDDLDEAAESADGQWLAYIEDGPVLVNRASGETRYIAPSVYGFGGNRGGQVIWHPTENWFISVEEGVAGCGSSYHTQVTNGETRYEVDISRSVKWLPAQVDPSIFPAFEKPIPPQPSATLHAQDTITRLLWSDDGSTLYGYNGYGEPRPVAAWDVQTGAPLTDAGFPTVPEQPEDYYFLDRPVQTESDTYVVLPDGVYDKRSDAQAVDFEVDLWTLGGIFQISADEQVVLGSAILEPVRIWSLIDGELRFVGLTATAAVLSPDDGMIAVASGWDVHLYTRDQLGY